MILTKSEQFREQVPPAFSEQVKKCVVHNYVVSFQSLRKPDDRGLASGPLQLGVKAGSPGNAKILGTYDSKV